MRATERADTLSIVTDKTVNAQDGAMGGGAGSS